MILLIINAFTSSMLARRVKNSTDRFHLALARCVSRSSSWNLSKLKFLYSIVYFFSLFLNISSHSWASHSIPLRQHDNYLEENYSVSFLVQSRERERIYFKFILRPISNHFDPSLTCSNEMCARLGSNIRRNMCKPSLNITEKRNKELCIEIKVWFGISSRNRFSAILSMCPVNIWLSKRIIILMMFFHMRIPYSTCVCECRKGLKSLVFFVLLFRFINPLSSPYWGGHSRRKTFTVSRDRIIQ